MAPSSPKPSKHVCPDCGRSYKAAETLNRHRKNHIEGSEYSCTACDASFKRKDLLDRHSQIHTNGHRATNKYRSPRACVRCSRLKTRCDNGSPCTRCARGGHACQYRPRRASSHRRAASVSEATSMHSSSSAETLSDAMGPTATLAASPYMSTSTRATPCMSEPVPAVDWSWNWDLSMDLMDSNGWQSFPTLGEPGVMASIAPVEASSIPHGLPHLDYYGGNAFESDVLWHSRPGWPGKDAWVGVPASHGGLEPLLQAGGCMPSSSYPLRPQAIPTGHVR
jgi:hypothetical protein